MEAVLSISLYGHMYSFTVIIYDNCRENDRKRLRQGTKTVITKNFNKYTPQSLGSNNILLT